MYKMYNAQCDDKSDDDKSSLNSSFWSDGERREEEEEEEEKVVIERVISEEDSKPVACVKDSPQEASEEEKVETERVIAEEDSKPVDDDDDSHQEFSEEEEEESERVKSEEDSKPVDDVDESHQEFSEESEQVKSEEDSESFNDEEDSEEEVKIEQEFDEEDSKTVSDSEESPQESSEEEEPELNSQGNMSRESSEGGSDDDDDDDKEEKEEGEEEEESSGCDSPAPSLMTSGYGTYRPEEQEGGDYRDDHTVTEFDQDSRGDLSEMRDDEEDDRSLCSFSGFDIESTEPDYSETRPLSVSEAPEPEANVACCGDELDITDMRPEEDKDQADEEKFEDMHAVSENEMINAASEEKHHAEDKFILDGKHLERGSVDVESREEENNVEKEDKVESEDPDESSSNKDIKFIDSKVDFSQMTYDEMCMEWEGNLRHKKDAASCLEERLAELHLSTAARRDFETENEDVTSHSDTHSSETDGVSMSAFESYLRGVQTRAHSDGDVRPKPKSFIRPVRHQPTIKKTDPVAKYFQYKQLWEMFKLPGETDRKAIRLEIKERLAYQPPPPKPRRVYVPNTYIVPTEKKRSALRWEIRNDLANGLLPYKFSYRF